MSFPRYPKYKDSGIYWLGKVPEHWRVQRLKNAADICMGQSPPSEQCNLEGIGLPFLQGCAEFGTSHPTAEKHCDAPPKVAKEGDLLFSVRAPVGKLNVANMNYGIGRGLCAIRPNRGYNPRYLFYWLSKTAYALDAVSTGSTYEAVSVNQVASSVALTPEAGEQLAIAEFLDRETAKIDALIAEQQRLIELLQEKRQAVISHAVTKGLNPNAAMKDSGVEWLGEVPEHWDVVQIKWLSPVKRGASPRPIEDPKYFDECGEYAWVRISDVTSSNGRLEATSQRLSELGSSLSVKLKPGSLFVSIAGSVGKPCITRIKACIHDGFVYFPDLRINPGFLESIFISGDCFGGLGKLGTQLNLNTDTIGAIRIGVPRVNKEVDAIVEYCKQESERLGELEVAAFGAIYLLNERRSALISAAVTGQIDVRGLMQDEAGQQ